MASTPTNAEMARYIATARQREQVDRQQKEQRQKRGIQITKHATVLLKERFHVQ